ncbi:mRNA turnover protein-like protein 4 [Elsinoe ampelina]|uniref:Ribosome assembly factor mrt4 n=1 Tax=Elsinoe ampelina TaxID=302913 RepID=A0A6A6GJ68_9PEZI|nr:mRNA turnover protein-like protein 4 [Elsinoe ampelina]
MPKSKRSKIVHLTKVQKKDKDQKTLLYTSIREAVDTYARIFIFSVAHMRNTFLKDVRQHFSDSRIFFGKTKVMAKALGMSEAEEAAPGLAKLAGLVDGSVGLLLTDRTKEEVRGFCEGFAEMDFARAGVRATREVTVPGGVVMSRVGEVPVEDDVAVPHSLEVTLRKWGMPTRLDKGKVMLDQEWTLCKEGEVLNSHQTALLKVFGITMVEFKVRIKAVWDKETEEVEEFEDEDAVMEEG